jgi:hypothetical protein
MSNELGQNRQEPGSRLRHPLALPSSAICRRGADGNEGPFDVRWFPNSRSEVLALRRNSLGLRRLVVGPDPELQLNRSDFNHCAVGQPHMARDGRVLNERAVLASEVLNDNRVVSPDDSDAGMTPRHAGSIQPDGALWIAANGIVPILEHDHALVPHQPESNGRSLSKRRAIRPLYGLAAECIANRVNRADEFRVQPGVLERAPDLRDQHIQVRVHDVGIRPDPSMEVGFVQHPRPMLDQRSQQIERLRGQADLAAAAMQKLPRARIQGEIREPNPHSRCRTAKTLEIHKNYRRASSTY